MTPNLRKALEDARRRQRIVPRGSSSISRVSAVLSDGVASFLGRNSYKSHPVAKKFSETDAKICIHAEVSALIKASSYFTSRAGLHRSKALSVDLSSFSISVARVLADGSPALARPCQNCQRALDHFNITKIEWTE